MLDSKVHKYARIMLCDARSMYIYKETQRGSVSGPFT